MEHGVKYYNYTILKCFCKVDIGRHKIPSKLNTSKKVQSKNKMGLGASFFYEIVFLLYPSDGINLTPNTYALHPYILILRQPFRPIDISC